MANILVIDDDNDFRTILCATLEDAGHAVNEAGDGLAGIRSFRDSPADIVLTDMIMPEREGIETILELKRDFPDVKIIAMSGGGRLETNSFLSFAGKFGACGTLEKPFSAAHLLSAIDKVLADS